MKGTTIQMTDHLGRPELGEAEVSKSHASQDNEILERTGKLPVLKRNFGFMSILGFSCLVIGTWGGAFVLLGVCLENGGPAGVVYSFILVWIGNLATFSSLAELASMSPTAGGQYHWVSILAPASSQKLLSYVTGWLTVAGWQANVASSTYVLALLLQGFIELVNENYQPQLWQATLLLYAALALAAFATTVVGTALPMIETVMLVIYVCGYVGVMVPLVYLGPHSSAKEVFTTFLNNGNWSTQGLSFFVGISGNAFAFLGADSVYHMSEEIRNAAIVVPKAIVCCILLNGVVGLSMYIAILFCMGDLNVILNSRFVFPFIEVQLQATNSVAGTAVMLAIMIIVDLGLVIGCVAAASRMLWSFARDRGVPGWRSVSRVDPKTSIPIRSILVTVVVTVLVGLISVGSPVAFNDVISLTVGSLYASYFVACSLLMWRRCQGSIKDLSTLPADSGHHNTNLPGSAGSLVWGPWRIPEPMGTIVNGVSCTYLLLVFVFTFFPPAVPVTPNTMNYSCLVLGAAAIMSGVYYAIWAHKTYTGPVIELEG